MILGDLDTSFSGHSDLSRAEAAQECSAAVVESTGAAHTPQKWAKSSCSKHMHARRSSGSHEGIGSALTAVTAVEASDVALVAGSTNAIRLLFDILKHCSLREHEAHNQRSAPCL